MVKFSNIGAAFVGGFGVCFCLMGAATAQAVDPYEQYYGPRPTPYSQSYNQQTYQPQQYQQPYQQPYQAPQYQSQTYQQPSYVDDPYKRARIERQGGAVATPPQAQSQPVAKQEVQPLSETQFVLAAGLSGVKLTDSYFDDVEFGLSLSAQARAKFNLSPNFSVIFGVEGSYQYLGGFDFGGVELTTHSFGVAFIPGVVLFDNVSIYARAGVHFWSIEEKWTYWQLTNDYDGNDLMYGLATEVDITNSIGLRGDWTFYEINEGDGFNAGTIAVYYRF